MAKILLVEDDLDLAMIITDSLAALEYNVEHAATGPAARQRILANTYDLIILDWDLPGASGYEILSEYRGRGGLTPVVMLSGRNSFEEKEAALDAGADDYLTKPFALKELRARVRSLLRRTTERGPQPASPPVAVIAPVPVATMTAPSATMNGAGTVLEGKYILEEQIGQGETAVVWRGTHNVMNRSVVIKILAGHLVDNQAASARFLQECQSMARLNHPNIINVFEVGVAGKAPFVVMEYSGGETIRQIIEKHGAAPIKVALEIMVQICKGLQAAHNAGIIHRDLKPGNIIIQNQNDRKDMVVKIVDFGISFLSGSVERLTQDGTVVGTLGYIAPEQLDDVVIDSRVDLYALGVIFYEILTGRLPFESKTPHALLVKKVMESPEPVWTRRADIPRDSPIDLILQKALQKDRTLRYQSADQMRADVERVLSQRF